MIARMIRPLVAVALLASLALPACGDATSRDADTATPSEGVADAVSEVVVSCAANSIEVSSGAVMAESRGVQLRVSSTMPSGSYVTYTAEQYGMGEPLPAAQETWIRPLPPGDVEIACTTDGKTRPGMSAHVEVNDPEHHWRSGTVEDAGCTPGGMPSWAIGPGSGENAQAAVDDLVAQFEEATNRTLHPTNAAIGYEDADTQTWVALDNNGGLTIEVTRESGAFVASPDALCA